jgi:hypothetical protein
MNHNYASHLCRHNGCEKDLSSDAMLDFYSIAAQRICTIHIPPEDAVIPVDLLAVNVHRMSACAAMRAYALLLHELSIAVSRQCSSICFSPHELCAEARFMLLPPFLSISLIWNGLASCGPFSSLNLFLCYG